MKQIIIGVIIVALVSLPLAGCTISVSCTTETTELERIEIELDEAIALSQEGEIAFITVGNEELLITTLDGRELKAFVGSLTLIELQELGFILPSDVEVDRGD
ncbi:hypothetical protein ES708_30276 [subsurface metagenome]